MLVKNWNKKEEQEFVKVDLEMNLSERRLN